MECRAVVFVWIFVAIIQGLIWGFVAQVVSENKGYEDGFFWGFFLGIIGIIVVACKPDNNSSYASALLSKETEEESNKRLLRDGGWECTCGRVNPSYTGTCACGKTKADAEAKKAEEKKAAEKKDKSEKELLNVQKLKSYKDLLDSGVITQEEFDKKKSELLGL